MAIETVTMLTTEDNPYNPHTEFSAWLDFDMAHAYNTCGLLARFYEEDPALTDEENEALKEEAIDQIIKYDFQNLYKKLKLEVKPNSFDSRIIR